MTKGRKPEKKGRFAMCRMPIGEQDDSVLYDERDGRYIDGRSDGFPDICIAILGEAGALGRVMSAESILDIGAGTGQLIARLAEMKPGARIVGVEPCREARAIAVPGANLVESDDGVFEVVMCWHVLEHVFDPPAFVKDMVNRTRNGGLVIIATPNQASPFSWSKMWRGWIANHIYVMRRSMVRELMREAGLEIVAEQTWGGFPAPRTWWQEALNKAAKFFGVGDNMIIVGVKKKVAVRDNGVIYAMNHV